MTAPLNEEREISPSATFGALLSVIGKIVFGLTLIPLFLKSALPHTVDFAPERFFLSVAGCFVTAGWFLLRGKPRGGAFHIPGGARAINSVLSEVFYPALALFAVFCVSIVAIMIIGTVLCALFTYR